MMTMSASAQVYKIDNVDIYSFGTLESLKEFVAKQKLTGYESKIPPPPTKTSKCSSSSSSSQPQTRYNTRRSKLKRLPASSESSFSPSSSSSYEDKKGCVKPSSSPLSSSEERESGIGSSSSTHSSSWLDDDCSTLDDYLIKLDECLPVSSPRTLNDESHLDMNLDESTTTTTPPPPPTSSSKRNGDSTSDDDEIMVWEPNANSPTCGKAHCRLGCICPPDEFSSQSQQQQTSSSPVSNKSTASSSSSATSMQSQHCGRYECMFECLCSRRLRSSTRSNRSTAANDIVLPPASEANATSSATTTYSIGTRRREASVSSTNSIFSNSSLPYASNSRSSQLCKSPKSFRDDYYYYDRTTTNLGVSSSPSKYLNSKSQRQNNSNQTSNSNMTASKQTGKTNPTQQQQQQQKATVPKIQSKPVVATKTNTTAEFKPYTHRMLLQAKPMLIAGKQSILNDIPLIIEVFTAKWKREPPIAKKCLKLLWKLLNVLAYQSVNWREIEFDYERELTVRLVAVSEKNVAARSSPIRVRIMKFTPTKPANEDGSKFREIPKGLSGLQNGRYIVRECDNIPLKISFKENRPQPQLDLVKKEKSETNELVASPHFKENFFFPKSTIAENSVSAFCQSFSPVKSTSTEVASLNWSSPKGRYLPRVLCRSRPSHNQSSSSSNNSPSNRTSEIFKSLDTLFEKNNIYARHNQPQEPVKKEKPLTAIVDANYHEACQLVDSEEIVKSVNDLLNDLVSTVAAATSLPSPQSKKDIIVLNKNSENSSTNNQSNALVRKVVQVVKPPILKSSFLPIKPKPSQTTQPIYKVSLLPPPPIMNKVRTGPVKIAPRPPSCSNDHSNKKRDFSELNESEREEYLAHRKRKRKQDLSAIPSGRISANPTPSPTSTTTTTTLRLVDVGAASYDDSSSISSSNLSSPNAVAVIATSSSSNTNTSIKTQSSPLIISTSSLFKSRGQTSSSARKSSYSDNTSEENSNNMTQEDLDEEEEEEREEINYEDEEIDELEMDLDDEEGENDMCAQQSNKGRGRGRPRRDESLSLSLSSAPRNRSSISCSYSSDSDGEEGEGSKSGGEYRKTIPPNIHSLRERERRSRLKTLLTKLQLAFLESSEESESPGEWLIKANRMFKVRASKQAILHEAVHQIKVAERNERLLQQEREAELRRNISLKNILQSLTNRA